MVESGWRARTGRARGRTDIRKSELVEIEVGHYGGQSDSWIRGELHKHGLPNQAMRRVTGRVGRPLASLAVAWHLSADDWIQGEMRLGAPETSGLALPALFEVEGCLFARAST